MLLTIDGNANTSLGVFDGASLVAHWRLTTARAARLTSGACMRNLFELASLDVKSIEAIAIASVVPPMLTLKRMAETYFNLTPLFIDDTTDTGLRILSTTVRRRRRSDR
jgi:type III pantothenate kinase